MALKRVIPCLDVDDGRVVKGTNFVGLRDAGDPVELAARYDAEGADELVFLDITASHERRETIVELMAAAERCADQKPPKKSPTPTAKPTGTRTPSPAPTPTPTSTSAGPGGLDC